MFGTVREWPTKTFFPVVFNHRFVVSDQTALDCTSNMKRSPTFVSGATSTDCGGISNWIKFAVFALYFLQLNAKILANLESPLIYKLKPIVPKYAAHVSPPNKYCSSGVFFIDWPAVSVDIYKDANLVIAKCTLQLLKVFSWRVVVE